MALIGMQFDDLEYKADEWSDVANSKKWWKADLNISFPSTNQITFNEGSRLYLADHRVKVTDNETLSLPASNAATTFYFYLEIDNVNKTYQLNFSDGLPLEGNLTTIYNAVFGKYIHPGGTLNLTFTSVNTDYFVDRSTNQVINGVKTFAENIETNESFVNKNDSTNYNYHIIKNLDGTKNKVVENWQSDRYDLKVYDSAGGLAHNVVSNSTGIYHSVRGGTYRLLAFKNRRVKLWSGALYMRDGQTITLNNAAFGLDADLEALVLEFSRYDAANGVVHNYGSHQYTMWRGSDRFYYSQNIPLPATNAADVTMTKKCIDLNSGWILVGSQDGDVPNNTNYVLSGVVGIMSYNGGL